MATLKELRLEARLSVHGLARLAKVDPVTVDRAETGRPVQEVKAYSIVQALSKKLGQKITMDDIQGLNIL